MLVSPYSCEVCGKRFAKSHHLKAHMNTHNKTNTVKNQQQTIQNQTQQLAVDDQTTTQHVYALEMIDESQMDDDSANEGDITEYLTHANIITKDEDGATSESEGQLMFVDVLDAIKGPSVKRKFVTTKGGQLHEITIAESDPIDLLEFEDDELE